ALIELIDSANRKIDAHFYQVNNMDIINAFVRAARRIGAHNIRFITEDKYYNQSNYKQAYGALENAGIKVYTDKMGDGIDRGQSHNKFAVVDDRYVWMGSYNITSNCTFKNPNNGVKLDSREMAQIFTREFKQMYEEGKFSIKKSAYDTPFVRVGDAQIKAMFSPQEAVKEAIVNEINQARQSIYFCIFTFTDELIVNAIINKARQGVKVYGVLDAFQAKSQYSSYHDFEKNQMSNLNIKKDLVSGLLHHKFLVVDPESSNATVITGSKNWTAAADKVNDESTLIIKSKSIAQKYYHEVGKQFGDGFDKTISSGAQVVKYDGPVVLITEVAFKNSSLEGDWIELYVVDDKNSGFGFDISGWSLFDDETFKTFRQGTKVKTGEFITISQGMWSDSTSAGFDGELKVYVESLSLATTDEQVMLKNKEGKIIDAVAWANNNNRWSPGEKEDMLKVFSDGAWSGFSEDSCFNSEEVHDGYSIKRRYNQQGFGRPQFIDTDSSGDWIVSDNPTPGKL
ncbi:MAG: phospholipase D-like domain-containing protein, partial [Candidatus Muiribacteriota bacterium]